MSFLHAGVWGGLALKKNGLFGLAGVFDRFAAIQITITAPIPNIQRSAIRNQTTTSAFDFHVFYDESRLLLIRSETVLSPLGSLGGKLPSGGFSFGCALSWPELLEFICASEPIREEFSPNEEPINDSVAAATAIAPLMPVEEAFPAKAVMPAALAARPAENAPLKRFEPTEFPVAIAL